MERYIAAAEGAIEESLPPQATTKAHHRTRHLIFVAEPNDTLSDEEAATRVVKHFLMRAYRRPPTMDEIEAVMAFYRQHRGKGSSFERAITDALPAVLV